MIILLSDMNQVTTGSKSYSRVLHKLLQEGHCRTHPQVKNSTKIASLPLLQLIAIISCTTRNKTIKKQQQGVALPQLGCLLQCQSQILCTYKHISYVAGPLQISFLISNSHMQTDKL